MRKLSTTEHLDDVPVDATALRAVRDLAGMQAEDASGIPVGTLFGALAEADTGLLRYLDLSLQPLDRHVLVPIGHARFREIEREEPRVRLRAALLEELESIPPFPADVADITDPFERALLEAYGRTFHGERYYAHPAYDHKGLYAGDHPIVTDAAPAEGALRRLSYLPNWRVASGEADVRGWPLQLDDATLELTDLVVDTGAGMVRYAVVAVREGAAARLLPIGYLQIDRDASRVLAPGLTREDVLALPAYGGGGVTREQEDALAAALRRRLSGRRRYQLADYRPDPLDH